MTLKRGRAAKPRPILSIRELTRDDLLRLKEKRTTPMVQRFRDPHHRLARLIATGMRLDKVAEHAGYSHSRVLMFSADPAFNELVAHYRGVVTEAYKEGVDSYFELATSNMVKAERQIAEKLDQADEDNELLPTRELIAISRDAADRFGYGKRQTNLNVNVDFAAQLEKAIARSGKVIDITPRQVAGPASPKPVRDTGLSPQPAPVLPTPRPSQAPHPTLGRILRRA